MDFGNIDFSQYLNWRPVRTPTGGTYYVVPGTSFVYDPFLSSTRGRPVLWTNPEPTLKEKADAEKAQRDARSPLNQILPVAGTVAGAVGANYAIDALSPSATEAATNVGAKLTEETLKAPEIVQAARTPSTVDAFTNSAVPPPPGYQTPVSGGAAPYGVQSVPGADGAAAIRYSDGSVTPAPAAAGTGTGLDWGAVAQGGVGALQTYQGVNQLTGGKPVQGAINTGAGLANISAATGYSGVGSQTLAAAAPFLAGAAGILGAIDTAKVTGGMARGGARNQAAAMSGAAAGAGIGTALGGPLIGTAIGAAIGYLGSAAFGSGKSKQQFIRDSGRKYLQETGIIDQEYKGTLADGSKFDFGKDGKGLAKLNYDDPVTGKVIALTNVLSSGEGMTGKAREAMAELYTNAALSNSGGDINKAKANVAHMAQQRGFTLENVQQQLAKLLEEKKIKQHEYEVFSNDARELFAATPGAGAPPTPPGTRGWQPGDPVSQQSMQKLGKKLANRLNKRK